MFFSLLQGKDLQSSKRLERLQLAVGDNPSLLWYPSAGADFRDVYEFTRVDTDHPDVAISPNLFIHTDYALPLQGFKAGDSFSLFEEGSVFVTIDTISELTLSDCCKESYAPDPNLIESGRPISPYPIILLLDVSITDGHAKRSAAVIYFSFENFNFLEEMLLKQSVGIDFLLKVREGVNFGGGRISIATAYPLLHALKVKVLIADDEGDIDTPVLNRIVASSGSRAMHYRFTPIRRISPLWSGMNVRVFSPDYSSQRLFDDSLKDDLLADIRAIDPEAYSS